MLTTAVTVSSSFAGDTLGVYRPLGAEVVLHTARRARRASGPAWRRPGERTAVTALAPTAARATVGPSVSGQTRHPAADADETP